MNRNMQLEHPNIMNTNDMDMDHNIADYVDNDNANDARDENDDADNEE